MGVGTAIAVATTFSWLGMVLAISFIEAPLKFTAPGVTLKIGLGIGRLVFRVLNIIELVLAAAIIVAMIIDPASLLIMVLLAVAIVALLVQVLIVRPRLSRRTDAVLAGTVAEDAPRSRAHFGYVGTELIKVLALLIAGIALLVFA
ncbi:hypothetical protein FOE78_17045 [Microlunatus elymi]|uniref:DUF4149 domain-containing protein n=1 Tax=Microlunatus elymi TaxID=2596828 RepID=A0A516Q1U0_9ACTN|nr:hypothetical protein [Microlunatus elymi]QDP97400.1 hypothetical protein FOE78_17045 [Microlunatus elymi]